MESCNGSFYNISTGSRSNCYNKRNSILLLKNQDQTPQAYSILNLSIMTNNGINAHSLAFQGGTA